MNLQTYQQQLAHSVKQTGAISSPLSPADDLYMTDLHRQGALARVRQIGLFWRRQQLRNFCPLTCQLLTQFGQFDEILTDFYGQTNVSAYIEQAGRAFLRFVSERANPLVTAIARFEWVELDVRTGVRPTATVDWPAHPFLILGPLLHNEAIDRQLPPGTYQTIHQTGQPFIVLTL